MVLSLLSILVEELRLLVSWCGGGRLSYLVFMSKSSTHRMHDT
jgi:hypothetical protein